MEKRLITGKVPILNEVFGNIGNWLSNYSHTDIMPWKSGMFGSHDIRNFILSHLLKILQSHVIVLYSWIQIIFSSYWMLWRVISSIANIQTSNKGDLLVNHNNFLVMSPHTWNSIWRVSDYSYIWRYRLKCLFRIVWVIGEKQWWLS